MTDTSVLAFPSATMDGVDQVFSSPEVCRLAGITYRQLDYWCRTGVITPMRVSDGSGMPRRWATKQVDIIRVLGRLSALGVCMQAFRTAAEELTHLELERGQWVVVATDGSVELVGDIFGIPVALARVPEASWVVPLAA